MKKGIKIFTAGTIVCLVGGTIIKESLRSIKEIKEAKQSVETFGEILDPFVDLYYTFDHKLELFEHIIREKLTLSQVKILRSILSNRCDQMPITDCTIVFIFMIDIIEHLVPKEGSLSDRVLTESDKEKNS